MKICIEIQGDRREAEELYLEATRLAKRYGLDTTDICIVVQNETASDDSSGAVST